MAWLGVGLELDKRCFWFAWGVLARFRVGLVGGWVWGWFGVGLGVLGSFELI